MVQVGTCSSTSLYEAEWHHEEESQNRIKSILCHQLNPRLTRASSRRGKPRGSGLALAGPGARHQDPYESQPVF
jgi:hypothetical protein